MSSKKLSYGNFPDISERIKLVRGELKAAQFAKILGILEPTLHRYEAGRKPPADVLQKIADYGGVTVEWLLKGDFFEAQPALRGALMRLGEHEPDDYEANRPAEIQEFLFVEVYQVVSAYARRKKYDQLRLARLLVRVYNHCVENLDRPSELLCEKYDPSIP